MLQEKSSWKQNKKLKQNKKTKQKTKKNRFGQRESGQLGAGSETAAALVLPEELVTSRCPREIGEMGGRGDGCIIGCFRLADAASFDQWGARLQAGVQLRVAGVKTNAKRWTSQLCVLDWFLCGECACVLCRLRWVFFTFHSVFVFLTFFPISFAAPTPPPPPGPNPPRVRAYMKTHAHTYMYTDTQTQHSHTFAHANTHTRAQYTHTRTHTQAPHSRTHARTHARTHTHTHTHTRFSGQWDWRKGFRNRKGSLILAAHHPPPPTPLPLSLCPCPFRQFC